MEVGMKQGAAIAWPSLDDELLLPIHCLMIEEPVDAMECADAPKRTLLRQRAQTQRDSETNILHSFLIASPPVLFIATS